VLEQPHSAAGKEKRCPSDGGPRVQILLPNGYHLQLKQQLTRVLPPRNYPRSYPPLLKLSPSKSAQKPRSATTATRPSGSHHIDRRPHRGSLSALSIAPVTAVVLHYRRPQAIRAQLSPESVREPLTEILRTPRPPNQTRFDDKGHRSAMGHQRRWMRGRPDQTGGRMGGSLGSLPVPER
jgi:hypothetical protein